MKGSEAKTSVIFEKQFKGKTATTSTIKIKTFMGNNKQMTKGIEENQKK